jgi:hypothetical protein
MHAWFVTAALKWLEVVSGASPRAHSVKRTSRAALRGPLPPRSPTVPTHLKGNPLEGGETGSYNTFRVPSPYIFAAGLVVTTVHKARCEHHPPLLCVLPSVHVSWHRGAGCAVRGDVGVLACIACVELAQGRPWWRLAHRRPWASGRVAHCLHQYSAPHV